MYIKEVVIDGFKSYARITYVGEFDYQFTAITGLNGSGKSNILDAICFVLGISNLSQVRASSLQDLVYKSGQSGYTKATVSITFDNTMKEQSPIGYESKDKFTITRQIVIGGRNKYMIDGVAASPSRIQDLFGSVQLNVNNPHFLILQGRITKVLNMKPPEILAMIEEAAGTRIWEYKKSSAQKTIEKKNQKLCEINRVLDEEITPSLAKLRSERQIYLTFQKCTAELERLTRLQQARDFLKEEHKMQNSTTILDNINNTILEFKNKSHAIKQKIQLVTNKLTQARESKDGEKQGRLNELQAEIDSIGKDFAKQESKVKHFSDLALQETREIKRLQKACNDDEIILKSRQNEINTYEVTFQNLQADVRQSNENLKQAQIRYQEISTGNFASGEGESQSLQQQLMSCTSSLSQAKSEQQQSEIRITHLKEDFEKAMKECESLDQEYQKEKMALDKFESDIKSLEQSLSQINYSDAEYSYTMEIKTSLKDEIFALKQEISAANAKIAYSNFNYKRSQSLNENTVKGSIAKLVTIKSPEVAIALETVAGGKLWNVVVDNEETGKKLLKSGLEKRVTIIPLNKILARTIPPDKLDKAEKITNNQAKLAIELLDYPNELYSAISFVFGGTIVCKNIEHAKEVAYKVGLPSVTLEGDKFDPVGLITGGSRTLSDPLFLTMSKISSMEQQLSILEEKSAEVESKLQQLRNGKEIYDKNKQTVDLKRHEMHCLKTKLEGSNIGQQIKKRDDLSSEIKEQELILIASCETIKHQISVKSDLENKLNNVDKYHEEELKKAELNLQTCKEKSAQAEDTLRQKEGSIQAVLIEAKELKTSLDNYKEEIQQRDNEITNCKEKNREETVIRDEISTKMGALKNELKERKDELRASNEELRLIEQQIANLKEEDEAINIDLKNSEYELTKVNRESKEAGVRVENLLKNYSWIATDRQYFGVPNSAYDFNANDEKHTLQKLSKLTTEKDSLTNKVNMRAMSMLSKAEEKYNELMNKKQIVENDKTQIANVILELDTKKNEALKKAWELVNIDFQSIFSTLLPESTAILVPPEGATFMDGLEFKVAFNGLWKESLSELSGGQRSLIALSLILALLLFKPAPLYILDEIDAALDLSHTQNIGLMLQNHFKKSQFIIVSLKEGMFNNANVLFKTKFVDGVSTVSRMSLQ